MSAILPPWPRLALAGCSLMLGAGLVTQMAVAEPGTASQPAFDVTNVLQVTRLSSENPNVSHFIRLEGTVWWANPAQRKLVLHDTSGTAELEMDFQSQSVQPGQRVLPVAVISCSSLSRRRSIMLCATPGPPKSAWASRPDRANCV